MQKVSNFVRCALQGTKFQISLDADKVKNFFATRKRIQNLGFTDFLFLFSCSKDKEKSTEKYLSASDSISYYLRKAESLDLKKTEKVKILDKATTIIKKSENSLKNRELNFIF